MEKKHTRKILKLENNELAVEELRAWLKKNSSAWLAARLGYKVGATVEQWVNRGAIPHYQKHRVLRFIRKHPDVFA